MDLCSTELAAGRSPEPTGTASKGIASRTKAARRPRFLTSLSMSPRMSLCCTLRTTSGPALHSQPNSCSVFVLRRAPCTCAEMFYLVSLA